MSRPLIVLILVIVLVIGGMVFLAGRSREQPQTRVEKVVPLANLQS
ncbi:hypothetical protein [uncultured Sphingomonas sp.]